MPVKFVIDGAALAEVLRGPNGPVARYTIEQAQKYQDLVKADIKRTVKTTSGGPKALANTLVKRAEITPVGVVVHVIAQSPHALFVHNGTKGGTIITAKNGGALAFFWPNGPNGAGMYFYQSVTRAATTANPFFTRNLKYIGHL